MTLSSRTSSNSLCRNRKAAISSGYSDESSHSLRANTSSSSIRPSSQTCIITSKSTFPSSVPIACLVSVIRVPFSISYPQRNPARRAMVSFFGLSPNSMRSRPSLRSWTPTTSKIDSLASEQRRLIELLKEKRQAVIFHAVTKGLDPSVPIPIESSEYAKTSPQCINELSCHDTSARQSSPVIAAGASVAGCASASARLSIRLRCIRSAIEKHHRRLCTALLPASVLQH